MAWATYVMKGISMGASASGAWMQGEAAESEAKGQAAMMRYNADVADTDAISARQKGTFDQIQARRAGDQAMGTLRARLGASGAVVSEGAPLYAQAAQVYENEMQQALIGYETSVKERQYRTTASNLRTGAQFADLRAKYARAGKTFGVISAAFGGASSMMS